ncbi:uncharacterized protein FFUJ_06857 [Fusarium fujikuroi IMI 58289]|uniref:Amidase domain-containing protein n=1 Tax=Gibberella fujikuroi (strain CBS 195.34 / IMI 58289 / NRRL A-6831) TaxID=1279085 RepID=S0DZS4_GIBF5|nr:uncharacterized protein FFUJ_06857 [Fusarium fujikuroi IMI 58289]KLP02525.1 uncharacterized protein LW94_8138 [Fusarium fujikuroi]CCT68094.1 uncharacterized protein FFUJ_06857 [Fusarium fujikuroi IMI 58289]
MSWKASLFSNVERVKANHITPPMASLNPTIIFEAGGKRYVTTEAIPFQSPTNTPLRSQLVTVFANHDGIALNKAWLETYLDKLDGCDVYDRNLFLSGVIITTPHRGLAVPQDSWEYLKELGMKWLDVIVEGDEAHLPTGPYLYTDNKLHPVCRLYDDEKGAFFSGLKPKLDLSPLSVFEQLGVASTSSNCLVIAVPPQAPTLATNTLPKLRIAVKDCFFVRGMKTSLCNRAYHELSEPATFTADVIQALINDGAQILGLTKLSSMIAREEPMDAVDYSTAFNPRGYGYQSPAGSSSGSAAAVAAYDWLDCAIGTDTSGSGRRPALANGVWQFRPSHDSISLRGLVKTYAIFDTPCIFARSLDVIRRVAKTWIATPLDVKKRPYCLIYPSDYLPTKNPEQMKIIGSHTRQRLLTMLSSIFMTLFGEPFIISSTTQQQASGNYTPRDMMANSPIKWLHNQFFGNENFETFVILPVAEVKPVYRDEKAESPETQSACDQLFLPPILGSPDVVVPIGETRYYSKISNKIEYLPVVANIVAAPGRDHEFLEAVDAILERSGRSNVVSTGSRIFAP